MSKKRNAFALSIVLWIVAVLLLGIAFIASLSKDSLKISYMLKDKLETQIIAKNYLEALKYYIMISDNDGEKLIVTDKVLLLPNEMFLDGRLYKIGNISISLEDLSSMIRPNDLSSIIGEVNDRELSFIIRDSINDWLDLDDNVRLNGAESGYYKIKNKFAYKPSNINLFQSIGELKLVRGIDNIDRKIWANIKNKVTYKEGIINLRLIDIRYLASIFHIDIQEAKEWIKLRKRNMSKFISMVEQNKYFNDGYMWFGISKIIRIKISVIKNKSKTNLYTTFYFDSKDKIKVFYIDEYKIY